MSYCEFTKDLDESHPHRIYHDNHYGFPIEDDNELFGRLILEINQAGLNWLIILKKERNFREAFNNFNIDEIACYKASKIEELMNNVGIIRNKLKIEAVIHNANTVKEIKKEFGSFKKWLDLNNGKDLKEWTSLFKKKFKFTGGLIVEEFLMSTGYLKGSHDKSCEIYKEIIKLEPKWKVK
ncbi:MAG: DNA-3-methyladenine glycosylase [Fluviicola sp.]|nr:MAG: DNA-3-methyladenine glycosylase [Fluviicola sp.]